MKILIACEESQTVCIEFRKLGFEAYSCDVQECSGGHPEWHLQQDVFEVIESQHWDCMIAFPPCTYLCTSGARWLYNKDKSINIERYDNREKAFLFVEGLWNANIDYIAIENPVGVLSAKWQKPNQIINPYQFGHPEQKKTCLWLKNLPELVETDNVKGHMLTLPIQQRTRIHWLGSGKAKERSKTYKNIAKAMAEQWGAYLLSKETL